MRPEELTENAVRVEIDWKAQSVSVAGGASALRSSVASLSVDSFRLSDPRVASILTTLRRTEIGPGIENFDQKPTPLELSSTAEFNYESEATKYVHELGRPGAYPGLLSPDAENYLNCLKTGSPIYFLRLEPTDNLTEKLASLLPNTFVMVCVEDAQGEARYETYYTGDPGKGYIQIPFVEDLSKLEEKSALLDYVDPLQQLSAVREENWNQYYWRRDDGVVDFPPGVALFYEAVKLHPKNLIAESGSANTESSLSKRIKNGLNFLKMKDVLQNISFNSEQRHQQQQTILQAVAQCGAATQFSLTAYNNDLLTKFWSERSDVDVGEIARAFKRASSGKKFVLDRQENNIHNQSESIVVQFDEHAAKFGFQQTVKVDVNVTNTTFNVAESKFTVDMRPDEVLLIEATFAHYNQLGGNAKLFGLLVQFVSMYKGCEPVEIIHADEQKNKLAWLHHWMEPLGAKIEAGELSEEVVAAYIYTVLVELDEIRSEGSPAKKWKNFGEKIDQFSTTFLANNTNYSVLKVDNRFIPLTESLPEGFAVNLFFDEIRLQAKNRTYSRDFQILLTVCKTVERMCSGSEASTALRKINDDLQQCKRAVEQGLFDSLKTKEFLKQFLVDLQNNNSLDDAKKSRIKNTFPDNFTGDESHDSTEEHTRNVFDNCHNPIFKKIDSRWNQIKNLSAEEERARSQEALEYEIEKLIETDVTLAPALMGKYSPVRFGPNQDAFCFSAQCDVRLRKKYQLVDHYIDYTRLRYIPAEDAIQYAQLGRGYADYAWKRRSQVSEESFRQLRLNYQMHCGLIPQVASIQDYSCEDAFEYAMRDEAIAVGVLVHQGNFREGESLDDNKKREIATKQGFSVELIDDLLNLSQPEAVLTKISSGDIQLNTFTAMVLIARVHQCSALDKKYYGLVAQWRNQFQLIHPGIIAEDLANADAEGKCEYILNIGDIHIVNAAIERFYEDLKPEQRAKILVKYPELFDKGFCFAPRKHFLYSWSKSAVLRGVMRKLGMDSLRFDLDKETLKAMIIQAGAETVAGAQNSFNVVARDSHLLETLAEAVAEEALESENVSPEAALPATSTNTLVGSICSLGMDAIDTFSVYGAACQKLHQRRGSTGSAENSQALVVKTPTYVSAIELANQNLPKAIGVITALLQPLQDTDLLPVPFDFRGRLDEPAKVAEREFREAIFEDVLPIFMRLLDASSLTHIGVRQQLEQLYDILEKNQNATGEKTLKSFAEILRGKVSGQYNFNFFFQGSSHPAIVDFKLKCFDALGCDLQQTFGLLGVDGLFVGPGENHETVRAFRIELFKKIFESDNDANTFIKQLNALPLDARNQVVDFLSKNCVEIFSRVSQLAESAILEPHLVGPYMAIAVEIPELKAAIESLNGKHGADSSERGSDEADGASDCSKIAETLRAQVNKLSLNTRLDGGLFNQSFPNVLQIESFIIQALSIDRIMTFANAATTPKERAQFNRSVLSRLPQATRRCFLANLPQEKIANFLVFLRPSDFPINIHASENGRVQKIVEFLIARPGFNEHSDYLLAKWLQHCCGEGGGIVEAAALMGVITQCVRKPDRSIPAQRKIFLNIREQFVDLVGTAYSGVVNLIKSRVDATDPARLRSHSLGAPPSQGQVDPPKHDPSGSDEGLQLSPSN